MRGQAFIAASALAFAALAQPAAAQQYGSYQDEHVAQAQACQQSHTNRTIGGAAIGGTAGAVLGSQVSGRHHRTDGSILGAVVGAFLGGAIGNSTANAQPQCQDQAQGSYDPYYGNATPQSGDNQPYDNSGLDGAPYGK
jgi:uncharacterized protein YcfJ